MSYRSTQSLLKNIELIHDDKHGGFYINASYTVIHSDGDVYLHELGHLPIQILDEPRIWDIEAGREIGKIFDLGFGELYSNKRTTHTWKLIQSGTKEMTIDEIEKALGHKVKIVNTNQ